MIGVVSMERKEMGARGVVEVEKGVIGALSLTEGMYLVTKGKKSSSANGMTPNKILRCLNPMYLYNTPPKGGPICVVVVVVVILFDSCRGRGKERAVHHHHHHQSSWRLLHFLTILL